MSTNNTVIHMRLYTFAWRYSRERRQGQSRIAALRAAWRWTTAKWEIKPGTIVIHSINIGGVKHSVEQPQRNEGQGA